MHKSWRNGCSLLVFVLSRGLKHSLELSFGREHIWEGDIMSKAITLKNFFGFSYYYDKFKSDFYSTIRGKNSFMKYHTGFTYPIFVKKKEIHKAVLEEIHRVRIKDISIEILRVDIAPMKMNNRADFIKLLNSFRRFHKIKKSDEYITLFWLRKIHEWKREVIKFRWMARLFSTWVSIQIMFSIG